jgi:hypothetical protein
MELTSTGTQSDVCGYQIRRWLQMPIDNRDLVVEGARLTGRYKKQTFVCEVAKDGEGNLIFKVDGKEFKSPSSAGSHVMGGGAVNGCPCGNQLHKERRTRQ